MLYIECEPLLLTRMINVKMCFSMQTNPSQMLQKIADVKKEFSSIVQEAAAIQEAQKVKTFVSGQKNNNWSSFYAPSRKRGNKNKI